MKKRAFLLLSTIFLSPLAYSQPQDITQLNPNVVAAANCQGQITGIAISNYSSGILNEQRTKAMMYGATLYEFFVLFQEESLSHLQKYQQQYAQFEQSARTQVLESIDNGNFTWDSQGDIDVCTARMTEALTSPYPSEMTQTFRDHIKQNLDQRFEAMKNIMGAMQ
ncbi:hypothetical protein [Kushneria phosphatilytica]|uniref:Uncharacterized protein n=1 Tax=Kushneria phosphatilytica TaxID=657387 RepID=A0A1S1NVN3_9GAMM|nr:hypothetical protein [Kushneria phosphatilytica]OHV11190.1 hypothetical protein BH688_07655 [Kushneria phosphatilytica]QEL12240.1 hypothetical protein FY550_14580 [Kushneria phosphatilytica]